MKLTCTNYHSVSYFPQNRSKKNFQKTLILGFEYNFKNLEMLSYKILITIFITFQIAYSQIILDNDNFDEEIKKGVTFVSFISPDSQNWQQLSRTWEELAEIKMEGAKIAIVDCRKDGAQGPNRKLCVRNAVSIFTFFS